MTQEVLDSVAFAARLYGGNFYEVAMGMGFDAEEAREISRSLRGKGGEDDEEYEDEENEDFDEYEYEE